MGATVSLQIVICAVVSTGRLPHIARCKASGIKRTGKPLPDKESQAVDNAVQSSDVELAVDEQLIAQVSDILGLDHPRAETLIREVARLYNDKMHRRFTTLKFRERLKRTNPFLLKVRGVATVAQWAENQVQSALFASEEEALGHVLETIAKACHPHAIPPEETDDFDFEVVNGSDITAYQIKMSWDCMPMSSRKNLSNTIRRRRAAYEGEGKTFTGIFAPCYGRAQTSQAGQEYISMRSRDFWQEVGSGDDAFDFRVGEVCGLLCSEFREELSNNAIPKLIELLSEEGKASFGDEHGNIDYRRLFQAINR